MFEIPLLQASLRERGGSARWFSEGIATFGLVLTILGCARYRLESVAIAVGLYITAAYWFTASMSFPNRAVTIGRAFTDSVSGIRPAGMPAFFGSQLVGAAVAVL
jgi:glycerol uptake facilitator-like aquaporin